MVKRKYDISDRPYLQERLPLATEEEVRLAVKTLNQAWQNPVETTGTIERKIRKRWNGAVAAEANITGLGEIVMLNKYLPYTCKL